jgi:hypothetical protein
LRAKVRAGSFKDEAMRKIGIGAWIVAWLAMAGGCSSHKTQPYGEERQLFLPGSQGQVWAVAPALNLSGQSQVDALLQSDLLYQELQEVHGLTVIPVNRVVEVYASLKIDKVESEREAYAVCDLLGCNGLLIPTVTAYDPYNPPKLGASLQLFVKPGTYQRPPPMDTRALERSPTPGNTQPMALPKNLVQVVGMYDAADGTTLDRVNAYAKGRSDPNGLLGPREVLVSMDRYCGFCYHELLVQLLSDLGGVHPAQQAPNQG